MTTIAYRDGILAYDGRQCGGGDVIVTDDKDKLSERNGVRFFLSGATSDFPALMDAWFGTRPPARLDCDALVVDGDKLWLIGNTQEGEFWRCPLDTALPHAIGSGSRFALTAMDMGATAEDAVRMAAKRDVWTGGTIRSVRVFP